VPRERHAAPSAPTFVPPPAHVPLAPQAPANTPPPAYAAGSYPAIPNTPRAEGSAEVPPPGYPSYPPSPNPTPQPFSPIPHPMIDRGSAPIVDPGWQAGYGQPPRPSQLPGFDMAGTHSRDVVVRRVVWSLALILGVILVLVVASRL